MGLDDEFDELDDLLILVVLDDLLVLVVLDELELVVLDELDELDDDLDSELFFVNDKDKLMFAAFDVAAFGVAVT